MRLYIPDMDDFFSWMDLENYQYVVLRGFFDYLNGYPAFGSKEDIDLLVEDAALNEIRERYRRVRKRNGVKCDVYSVSGKNDGDFLGKHYYPVKLATFILDGRVRWNDKFYVPGAEGHLYSLIFHIAYQKAELSKIGFNDTASSAGSKYIFELDEICKSITFTVEYTLLSFHQLLQSKGYAVEYEVLVSYLQNDFSRGRKSYFLAWVMNELPGELNMYVIRKVAVKKQKQDEFVEKLKEHYRVMLVKDIPYFKRLFQSKHMRGGKWKRGGKPYIAVIVFDDAPVESTKEERETHPFVFNAKQFIKPALREWFAKETGVRLKENPIHSTDNEAEAVGHFPLFLSASEQESIFSRLEKFRVTRLTGTQA